MTPAQKREIRACRDKAKQCTADMVNPDLIFAYRPFTRKQKRCSQREAESHRRVKLATQRREAMHRAITLETLSA